MKKIDFPVGISDFSKIRENEYYYIDKTGLICEVLKNPGTEVTLITRPRRFGKTLGMSMLAEFFDIEKTAEKYFKGWKFPIMRNCVMHGRTSGRLYFSHLKM